MRADDLMKLDVWMLVEKERPDPHSDEVRNTGKTLGPFTSYEEAYDYPRGLGGGPCLWSGPDGVKAERFFYDFNQYQACKNDPEFLNNGYVRLFWYPEKLEK